MAATSATPPAPRAPAWPCRRPAALKSPDAQFLSARASDAGCKLASSLMYSPPALMVNSMWSLEGEPAVPPTPSVLWPATPSPMAAAMRAFRVPMASDVPPAPSQAVIESLAALQDGAAFFVPFVEATQQLAAAPARGCAPALPEQSFSTAQGQAGLQMPGPSWQFAQPPPPPVEPAPGHLPPAAECAQAPGGAWLARAAEPPAPAPRWSPEASPLPPQAGAGQLGREAGGGARPAPAPSAGAALHGTRECRPCAWYYKPSGCDMGKDCAFCHLCPEGEVKLRKKAKLLAIRRTFQKGGDR
ncbi:unnamed protein product [Prorocentrum cordatum]|uniref:C3H1-type domain-containing protein n=1 Tax=Prorocentrum cordatum TaxID=2364126 RepID=A0ABN9XUN3_9DINO|nr:unnamed protein product [Polarella glacialis]